MYVCLLYLAENAYNKCKIHYYYLNCVTACVHHVRRRVQPDDIRRSHFHRRCRTPDFVQITVAFHLTLAHPRRVKRSRCHISFRLERDDSLRSLMLPCQKITAAALGWPRNDAVAVPSDQLHLLVLVFFYPRKMVFILKSKKSCISHTRQRDTC